MLVSPPEDAAVAQKPRSRSRAAATDTGLLVPGIVLFGGDTVIPNRRNSGTIGPIDNTPRSDPTHRQPRDKESYPQVVGQFESREFWT